MKWFCCFRKKKIKEQKRTTKKKYVHFETDIQEPLNEPYDNWIDYDNFAQDSIDSDATTVVNMIHNDTFLKSNLN
tara:strand:+ start:1538 stop:1762 length:225 start_codon:yes stop_codon:yes gene_type:complete